MNAPNKTADPQGDLSHLLTYLGLSPQEIAKEITTVTLLAWLWVSLAYKATGGVAYAKAQLLAHEAPPLAYLKLAEAWLALTHGQQLTLIHVAQQKLNGMEIEAGESPLDEMKTAVFYTLFKKLGGRWRALGPDAILPIPETHQVKRRPLFSQQSHTLPTA